MNALRITLTQNQANYRKEETSTNKMTHPLPPFSTVIGAIHNACGFKEYHPMDVSIQGGFGSMQIEPYVNHTFFNSFQNDRGILVKLNNKNLHSSGFIKVAEAIKPQGNDFEKEITIRVLDRELLDEYQSLKGMKRELEAKKKDDSRLEELSAKIKELKDKQKTFDKKSDDFLELKDIIKTTEAEKKEIEENYKKEINEINIDLDKFATMVTSIKYYEVLYEVNLIIHIKASDETLDIIENNICNLKSIGRSEDFVDVSECKKVEIFDDFKNTSDDEIESKFTSYIKIENIRDGNILINNVNKGTKYYLNKDYVIEKNKRVFNKYFVLYSDKFSVEEDESTLGLETGIFIDEDNNIVNFV